jgi:hypothetical protein
MTGNFVWDLLVLALVCACLSLVKSLLRLARRKKFANVPTVVITDSFYYGSLCMQPVEKIPNGRNRQ